MNGSLPSKSEPSSMGLDLSEGQRTGSSLAYLHLLVRDIGEMGSVGGLGRVLGVDVQILEHDGLGEGGLVVDPGATFSMTAGADLEVEGTIDLVLLRAENGSQILGHLRRKREPTTFNPKSDKSQDCQVISSLATGWDSLMTESDPGLTFNSNWLLSSYYYSNVSF